MAEASQELSLLVTLRDQATAQLRQINAEVKDSAKTWQESFSAIKGQAQTAAITIGAMGAAITGAMFLSYRASEEQRLEIARLTVALRNVGLSYDDVSGSLNKYISVTEKATGISDSEQRGALSQLLMITGNYDRAMKLLPITFDLAKAKHMDVTTAAILLGRVAEGNINALNRYGFSMDGVKSAAEALNIIQGKVSGSANAMRSPFDNLVNSINDFKEAVGDLVSKNLTGFIDMATRIIDKIMSWMEKNPELAGQLLNIGLALGIAAIAAAGLTLAAIGLAVALALLGGPITLVILGIMLLIFLAAYLALNWETLRDNWYGIWQDIKKGIYIVLGPIGVYIATLIDWGMQFIGHWDKTKSLWLNIWNEIKLGALLYINNIIDYLNLLLGGIEKVARALGKKLDIPEIPKIGDQTFGIYMSAEEEARRRVEHNAGILKGRESEPLFPPEIEPQMPAPIGFGNYGRLGQTILNNITINNAGSVISSQDLMAMIRQEIVKLQNRNVTSGIQ